MIRRFAIAAALAAASASVPAIAQSYGGITLTFGNGGYNRYDYDEDSYYDRSGRQIYRPQFERRYRYNNAYEQRAYQREWEQYQWRLQQWQEQQRRYNWEQQRRGHDWRYDDDDD